MGFKSNNSIIIDKIYDSNNNFLVGITDQSVNFEKNLHVEKTLSADKLSVTEIDSLDDTAIIWNKPRIKVNNSYREIKTNGYFSGVDSCRLKMYFDLNNKMCWDRSSDYVTDLAHGVRAWGFPHTTSFTTPNSSHFTNQAPECDIFVMRTDDSGGNLRILQSRPEIRFGYSPFSFVVWVYNSNPSMSADTIFSQKNDVAGQYMIFRAYSDRYNIYEFLQGNFDLYYDKTNPSASTWKMLVLQNDMINARTTVYSFDKYNKDGDMYDQIGYNMRTNFDGDENSMAFWFGTSEWSTTNETFGKSYDGFLGPMMFFDGELSVEEMKTIFNYYKNSFGIE